MDENFDEDEAKRPSQSDLQTKYAKTYDEGAAFKLLKTLRKKSRRSIAGPLVGKIMEMLGHLLSAMKNPEMPAHLKALVAGAIAYIVLPVDLIPDMLPAIGWTDDLAAGGGVLAAVRQYSTFSLEALDAQIDAE